jgi:hypothetical protein
MSQRTLYNAAFHIKLPEIQIQVFAKERRRINKKPYRIAGNLYIVA